MNLKPSLLDNQKQGMRVSHEDEQASYQLSRHLSSLLPSTSHRPVVVVCIGTDRSTGDSLGPLVGTKLTAQNLSSFHVYGTLEEPIHAMNLNDTLKQIQRFHKNPFIIGIDACLGKMKNIGTVSIGIGPVKPGAGVNKDLPPVGDIHMTGIVNVSGFMEFFVLQNTRLYLVMKLADLIADSIVKASYQFPSQEKNTSFLQRLGKYKA
ncbi:spore protease YyaC [Priestia abyssalis]|uniref:spore protease YyaC n=1 Tax=Priestia abyssalis TaxID=1221450 RepID=UPI000994D017|nr:spore protease YyaC [Priestia abyssalis]